jgi:hypothetical protein
MSCGRRLTSSLKSLERALKRAEREYKTFKDALDTPPKGKSGVPGEMSPAFDEDARRRFQLEQSRDKIIHLRGLIQLKRSAAGDSAKPDHADNRAPGADKAASAQPPPATVTNGEHRYEAESIQRIAEARRRPDQAGATEPSEDESIAKGAMADLPELSDSTKRKLALQWASLLDDNRLTGEHLQWHAQARDRLMRIAAQGPRGSRRGSECGLDWHNERAADETGIHPSVTVAEARFTDLSGEYSSLWLSSGGGYEAFAGWLEELKRRVSSEIASVWKGGSKPVDRWFERACGPAIEKALTALVNEGIRRARADELKRLERDAKAKGTVSTDSDGNGASPAQPAKVLNVADRGGASWQDIEISFVSDERVQIRNGTNTETSNYGEFGFADRRAKRGKPKPNQAWVTLRAMAEQNGIIRDGAKTGAAWPKVEKRMQEIRKVLREHFRITADPIPFVAGTGYQARFKIGCSPSFLT